MHVAFQSWHSIRSEYAHLVLSPKRNEPTCAASPCMWPSPLPGEALRSRVLSVPRSLEARAWEGVPCSAKMVRIEHPVGSRFIPFNDLVDHCLCWRRSTNQLSRLMLSMASVSDPFPMRGQILHWKLGFGQSSSCHRMRALQHMPRRVSRTSLLSITCYFPLSLSGPGQ